jgi:hypothetical protein
MKVNKNYRHKDYSGLLKELQKNVSESTVDTDLDNLELETAEQESDVGYEKPIELEYDLDALIGSVNDLNDLISLYNMCEEQVEYEQQITQDLLHAIEFSSNCKERYRYSTQLHYNRQRRRVYKNAMTVLKPIVEFVQKEENVKVMNKLSNILGEARKVKLHSEDKSYSPRILTELGVFSNGSNSNKNK